MDHNRIKGLSLLVYTSLLANIAAITLLLVPMGLLPAVVRLVVSLILAVDLVIGLVAFIRNQTDTKWFGFAAGLSLAANLVAILLVLLFHSIGATVFIAASIVALDTVLEIVEWVRWEPSKS